MFALLPAPRYGSDKILDRWLYESLEEAGLFSKEVTPTLKWPDWNFGKQVKSSFEENEDENKTANLLRRFMITATPSILLASVLGKANAAEGSMEAIRIMSSKTIPGLG